MMILEKDPQAEQQKEQERLAAQEKLYQVRPSLMYACMIDVW